MFLHDLEKHWIIEVLENGTVRNRLGFDTKAAFKEFREKQLEAYNIVFTDDLKNEMNYVEGEMNELAVFCHKVDVHSARIWFDYPKVFSKDEWIGADRVHLLTK